MGKRRDRDRKQHSNRNRMAVGADGALAGPARQGCDGAARVVLHALDKGGKAWVEPVIDPDAPEG